MTPETRQQIWEWYQAGCTPKAIADFTGFTHESVKGVIHRMKHKPPEREVRLMDRVAELMSQEMTFRQIAAELDVSIESVRDAFKRIKRALGPQAR